MSLDATVAAASVPRQRVLALSTFLHFLGFSPYVVVPALTPLAHGPGGAIFLALIGITTGSGLSSLAIGRSLDRHGSMAVAACGMAILAVGYGLLAIAVAAPVLWLPAGLVLGVGVQATGGQTAFHILQAARGDDAAKGHFIANLGVSASGLVLPWCVAFVGGAGGWSTVNLALSGVIVVAGLWLWTARGAWSGDATSNATAQSVGLLAKVFGAFRIPPRLLAIAGGFGVLASGTLIFSTLMARSGTSLAVSSSYMFSVALGAAAGRVVFAIVLSKLKGPSAVSMVSLLCASLQVGACLAVATPGLAPWMLCLLAGLYGVGTAANMALLPVFVHRNATTAPGGLALGQVRFAMTPFQIIALLLVGGGATTLSLASWAFLALGGALLVAVIAIVLADLSRRAVVAETRP